MPSRRDRNKTVYHHTEGKIGALFERTIAQIDPTSGVNKVKRRRLGSTDRLFLGVMAPGGLRVCRPALPRAANDITDRQRVVLNYGATKPALASRQFVVLRL
jgi:hypothetical protein